MTPQDHARYAAQAQIMKALAHPSRICIAQALGEGERCVCELTELVGADMSTVSKHLSLMKQAGIVDSDKRGTSIYYRLAMPCVLNFFVCANQVLKGHTESRMQCVA